MKFEENLREARKQNGYSQEELAEQLGVSRQAVSKWENGSGYPELDKLMALCELFHCTMDDLLKGDVKERDVVGIERYIAHHKQMGKAMTFGVFMCITALTSGAFLESYYDTPKEIIAIAIFFLFVIIGVLTFIFFGMQKDAFDRKYPEVPKDIFSEEEIDDYERIFRFSVVVGVGLILGSLVVQQVLEKFVSENIANGSFMFIVSIAVSIFVYFGMKKTMYEETLDKPFDPNKKEADLIGKVCAVIMSIATIIFLVLGFIWNLWQYNWIVFPVGGILCGIASIILHHDN